jgi:UDP-N-acetylmuramate dehydrogenase
MRAIEDTNSAMAFIDESGDDYYFLGEGSNTIFTEDYLGSIGKVEIRGITIREEKSAYHIKVAAGENWHQLVRWTLDNNMPGLENLALIPGTVGAAPIQNIGAYGCEVEQFIESVECLNVKNGKIENILHEQCAFAYRSSLFKSQMAGHYLILAVNLALPKQWQPNLTFSALKQHSLTSPKQIFEQVIKIRQAKLPDVSKIGNAGSFFKNPEISTNHLNRLQHKHTDMPFYLQENGQVKIPAAWLIDKLGLKGYQMGDIQVHPNHGLVLTNLNNGTGEELLGVARYVKDAVLEEYNITLENEVRLLGAAGEISL